MQNADFTIEFSLSRDNAFKAKFHDLFTMAKDEVSWHLGSTLQIVE